MAWAGCISVANHKWSYEPRMRTVRLINRETVKRNWLKQNFGIDYRRTSESIQTKWIDLIKRRSESIRIDLNRIKTPVLITRMSNCGDISCFCMEYHTRILGSFVETPTYSLSVATTNLMFFYVQYRIIIILWFLLVGDKQVAMQVHHLVITLPNFRNNYGIDILPDVCVKKVIRPPRLDNERHLIIS